MKGDDTFAMPLFVRDSSQTVGAGLSRRCLVRSIYLNETPDFNTASRAVNGVVVYKVAEGYAGLGKAGYHKSASATQKVTGGKKPTPEGVGL